MTQDSSRLRRRAVDRQMAELLTGTWRACPSGVTVKLPPGPGPSPGAVLTPGESGSDQKSCAMREQWPHVRPGAAEPLMR